MHRINAYMPKNISLILNMLPVEVRSQICEIRLRKGGALSVSTYSKNLFVTNQGKITNKISDAYICTNSDVVSTVSRLAEGSVYRYMSTINTGYIVTADGIRVGVAGSVVYSNGSINSVADFSCLNIRIPHEIDGVGDTALDYLVANPQNSVLIYSPPGVGKTTFIRSIAKGLGIGKKTSPKRVSVIDERGEILPSGSIGMIDRFLGYSKPDGIEIAVRLFNPEYIICDEIGLLDDTRAILSVQNSGVPFIATTHGKSIEDVLLRPNIRALIENNVFQGFIKLEREGDICKCVFEELKK